MESLISQILGKSNALEIVKFMDNKDLLNLELVSKQLKLVIDEYYFVQTNLLTVDGNVKLDTILNNAYANKENLSKFKRTYFKTFLNSFIPINISDKKYDTMIEYNENLNQENDVNLKKDKKIENKKEKKNVLLNFPELDNLIFSK
jgi:hypothetical protein